MDERQESTRPRSASRRDKRVVVAVILALFGAWISLTLTRFHLSDGQSRPAFFSTVCEITGGGCDHVLQSPWAMLPRHIPTAFAGLVYFSALVIWYLVVGRPNRDGRSWYAPILVLQILGALLSLFLLAVMLFQLRALCGWCALVHLINFTLAFLAWKLWPREPRAAGEPAWPPGRLGFAALLLVVVSAAFWNQWLLNSFLQADLASFRGDTDLMRYLHFRNPVQQIPLRADDPARGSTAPAHTVIVFSDFQCPACRNFAAFFKRGILPLPGGDRIRIVYKHLPLDRACNPRMERTLHLHACEAAEAAEAARALGGAEAFWKMHNALFDRVADVEQGRWSNVASSAGLDGAAIAQRVAQHSYLDRISEDVKLGYALKLRGTPGVFVDGRQLEDWSNLDLWKAILAAQGSVRSTTTADAARLRPPASPP